MEWNKRRSGFQEQIAPQLRKLFPRLRNRTIFHFRCPGRVIQRVSAFGRDLVYSPDCLVIVTVARDDLCCAESAVRLAGHEQARDRSRHWKLALPFGLGSHVAGRTDAENL
jgi:hypothetical protein